MIRFNLRKLLGELEAKTGRKITLREVSAQSKCDKNALSRILNKPEVMPSAKVIDQLVQYFFHAFKVLDPAKPEDVLMREIISKFIAVFPDDYDFYAVDPTEEELKAYENMGLEGKWQYYNILKYGSSVELKERYGDKPLEIEGGYYWRDSTAARTRKAAPSERNVKAQDTQKRSK